MTEFSDTNIWSTLSESDEKKMPVCTMDAGEYREHLDGFDLSEAQQNELLETLWNIMQAMVNIGWGLDTVHMMLPELFDKVADDSNKLLDSNDKPIAKKGEA